MNVKRLVGLFTRHIYHRDITVWCSLLEHHLPLHTYRLNCLFFLVFMSLQSVVFHHHHRQPGSSTSPHSGWDCTPSCCSPRSVRVWWGRFGVCPAPRPNVWLWSSCQCVRVCQLVRVQLIHWEVSYVETPVIKSAEEINKTLNNLINTVS